MNIQLFTLRTQPEFFSSDQKLLNDFLNTIVYVKSSEHFVATETEAPHWSILIHFEPCEVKSGGVKVIKEKVKAVEETDLTPGAEYILECLKDWRNLKAKELMVPAYLICSNATLVNVAFHQPSTLDELKKIKGFGEAKVQQFGEAIIALLNTV
ncbi:HRDC domain-containing protein [Flavobacterium sp.]|uniref:HRDC domain-containing protein n=1 Tax=Flavobacterium sp. TaxID=239 RepID=UPI0028BECC1D|nr:HRDC domain-containing protein [Flavobacterium sp.]